MRAVTNNERPRGRIFEAGANNSVPSHNLGEPWEGYTCALHTQGFEKHGWERMNVRLLLLWAYIKKVMILFDGWAWI